VCEQEAKYKNQWQSRATVLRSTEFFVYFSYFFFFVELHFVFRAWETFSCISFGFAASAFVVPLLLVWPL